MDWQCGQCCVVEKDVKLTKKIVINMIDGEAESCPQCSKCKSVMRPNIVMRDDLDYISDETDE